MNAGHAICDLPKSKGDVFNLAVQEDRLLDTFPFISSNPKAELQKAAKLVDCSLYPQAMLMFVVLTRTIVFTFLSLNSKKEVHNVQFGLPYTVK